MKELDLSDVKEYNKDFRKVLLKSKKRLKLKKHVKIILILILILIVVAYFISPLSKVKSFSFNGQNKIQTSYLKKSVSSYKNDIALFLKTSDVEKTLENIPLVDNAKVSKDFFGNVKCKISELEIMAYGNIGKETYVIDVKGRLLKLDSNFKISNFKKYTKCSNFKTKKKLQTFIDEYKNIPNVIKSNVSDVTLETTKTEPNRVKLLLDNGKVFYIRIDEMVSLLNEKNFNYQAYMSEYSDYTIFSFENGRIYMKKN